MALQLFVSLAGETTPIELPLMATVAELRMRVSEVTGLPMQRIKMTSGNACLTQDEDATTLADAGICPQSLVDISEGNPAVVIDCGSRFTRAGFAGEKSPRVVFPSIVGRPKCSLPERSDPSKATKDIVVGEEALKGRGIYKLKWPVEHGVITNYDEMEHIWRHAFELLGVEPEDQPVLLSEPAFNPTYGRDRAIMIMFEQFNVPAIAMHAKEALAVRSSGRSTGMAVDMGDSSCSIVPVYEGYPLRYCSGRGLELGGKDITEKLYRLCQLDSQWSVAGWQEAWRDADELKKELCYVTIDPAQDPGTENEFKPTGEAPVLTVGSERWRAPEILFDPSLHGMDTPGIHQIINQYIRKCDKDIRDEMYQNIVVSGGSSLFPGLSERLQREVSAEADRGVGVRVIAPEDGFETWRGGSMIASMRSFENSCITREEYEECGPTVMGRQKFF
eukprot:Hpha_TRINITY_DN22339_c0_g1::TRINITY_DN22339_c0_g1_i1::g.177632::m.177632/K05692/ACTB_G1; actin beta/gamma 1